MCLRELSQTKILMKVRETFCSDWSEDDNFFIMTLTGVDVFTFKPDPKSKIDSPTFQRSFIYPLQYFPSEAAGFEERQLSSIHRYDLSKVLYDRTIAPKLSVAHDPNIHFIKVLWSPKLTPYSRCMLALLTSVGGITIWASDGSNWKILSDISNFIYLHLERKGQFKDESKTNLATYVSDVSSKCYKLMTNAIVWSPVYTNGESTFVFFVTAQKDGTLLIWKILPSVIKENDISTGLVSEYKTSLGYIVAMHWIKLDSNKVGVVVGTLEGGVHCFLFELSSERSDFAYIDQVALWPDDDKIIVSHLTSMNTNQSGIRCLIILKDAFFIVITINEKCEVLHTSYENLDNLNIMGIKQTADREFAVSTYTGVVTLVKVNLKGNSTEITTDQLTSDINLDRMCLYGFSVSRHNALWALVLSPCKHFSRIFGSSWSTLVIAYREDINPLNQLLNDGTESDAVPWDYMELMRLMLLKNKFKERPELPPYTDIMSLRQTKCHFWMNWIIYDEFTASKNTKDLTKRIMVLYAEETLNNLLHKYIQEDLIDFEFAIVNGMFRCLSNYVRNTQNSRIEDLIIRIREIMGKHLTNMIKSCEWCDEELFYPVCSKDHPTQFCCISFQSVDDEDSIVCGVCGNNAHKNIMKMDSIQQCTFCGSNFYSSSLLCSPESNILRELKMLDDEQETVMKVESQS